MGLINLDQQVEAWDPMSVQLDLLTFVLIRMVFVCTGAHIQPVHADHSLVEDKIQETGYQLPVHKRRHANEEACTSY